ncbi:MAG: CRISPR-associated endonuclease Cas2 [Burkholderiales bacterium]|nr:CRISPR-associated endonuclease Cas2 [Burkholderiales bacterium]
MADFIICYDIANPRRLGHIHRRLKKLAVPLQYSVFLFRGTEEQLQRCLALLERQMNRHEDDIRAYPLPQRGLRLVLGPSALPDGVLWSALPKDWQPREHTAAGPDGSLDEESQD